MLLLVRLRSLLFEVCSDHSVAFCESCRESYRPEQLDTGLVKFFLCRNCGAHLGESLKAHARTCSRFLAQKPPARIDPAASDEVSDRDTMQRPLVGDGIGVRTDAVQGDAGHHGPILSCQPRAPGDPRSPFGLEPVV